MSRFPASVLAIGAVLVACSPAAPVRSEVADGAMVSGSVTYDEDVPLPPGAAVDVWIIDVTPGVVAAPVLAETTIYAGEARPPIPFKLPYDPKRVVADHDYSIKAVIRGDRETLFEMPNDFRVLTKDNPTRVDVWVKMVGDGTPGAAPISLDGTFWRVDDLGGEPVPPEAGGTLEFPEAGKVSGRAFCNQFAGLVETSGSSIRFGPLAVTKMSCGRAANERESSFLRSLEQAERYAVDGRTLLLYIAGSEEPLRLSRRKP